jgi:hypothetical protein
MLIGVPKHSELEPDYLLAKGNGNTSTKCGLANSADKRNADQSTSVEYPLVDWNLLA